MRILIIRLSAIGDTVHGLPVAAYLKKAIPGAEIFWLVEPPSAPLLVANPAVDQVLVLPKENWKRKLGKPWLWAGLLEEVGRFWSGLRQRRFDLALDLQGLLKSGLCAIASGARLRVGFKDAREGAGWLMTEKLDVDYFGIDRHVVDINLELAKFAVSRLNLPGNCPRECVQSPEFPLPEPEPRVRQKVGSLLDHGHSLSSPKGGLSVLTPGTTWSSKVWPWTSWYQLGRLLIDELGMRICIIGGAGDAEVNAKIAGRLAAEGRAASVLDLTGKTSLPDLIALFEYAGLVVGSDTGPLHLAAATGKPRVLAVMGSTGGKRNGPWGSHCRTVNLGLWCQPCHQKRCPLSTTACLRDLTAERVFEEILVLRSR